MKISILDGYALNPGDISWQEIESLGEVSYWDRTSPEQVLERCCDAEVVITNKVALSREILQQLPMLRLIAVTATGYNIIDTAAAHELGITVCNIPAYSTASVAQMVFSQLLTITNRVDHYTQQITHNGSWSMCKDFCYWDTPLIELEGKTIGIYGMGRIGKSVARIAMAMGMNVVSCTQKDQSELPKLAYTENSDTQYSSVTKMNEDEFWSSCDIITLHCPLTDKTHHLIDEKLISKLKQGVIILNTSRGPVVDEKALADALVAGKVGAFATDVLSTEPPTSDNPLLHAPNVFVTPHIAWATLEARERLMAILVDNIKAYINGKPQNCV